MSPPPLLPRLRLSQCPACGEHVRVAEDACPHCGARLGGQRSLLAQVAGVALAGTVLVACGAEKEASTGDTTSGSSGEETLTSSTDTDATVTTTFVTNASGEAYGVPETWSESESDSVGDTTGGDTTGGDTTGGDTTEGDPTEGETEATTTGMTTAQPDYGVPDTD